MMRGRTVPEALLTRVPAPAFLVLAAAAAVMAAAEAAVAFQRLAAWRHVTGGAPAGPVAGDAVGAALAVGVLALVAVAVTGHRGVRARVGALLIGVAYAGSLLAGGVLPFVLREHAAALALAVGAAHATPFAAFAMFRARDAWVPALAGVAALALRAPLLLVMDAAPADATAGVVWVMAPFILAAAGHLLLAAAFLAAAGVTSRPRAASGAAART